MTQTRQLSIDGMTCQMCVKHVTRALNEVPGLQVRDVQVGSAVVEYDTSAVSDDRVLDSVREAGYQARITA